MIVEDVYISSNTFAVIQPMLLCSRMLGLFPISYEKQRTQYRLRWSMVYGIYSYILSISLGTVAFLNVVCSVLEERNISFSFNNRKTEIVTCIDISIVLIIVVFGVITLPHNVKKILRILKCLNQADKFIPLMNSTQTRTLSIYFLAFHLFLAIPIVILDILGWTSSVNKREQTPISFIKNYFAYYSIYVIIIMKEVIIFHIEFLIKIKISLLNDELEELEKILMKNNRIFSEKVVMLNIGSFLSTEMGGSTKQVRKQDSKIQKSSDIVHKIMELAKFQDKILEAGEMANNSTEFGIYIIMLSCLLHLIVTSYFLLIEIFLRGSPLVIIQQLIWILVHVGRILLIVEPCQSCINEHKKTRNKVCELLILDMNEEVKNAMEYFSLQLTYCEMDFFCCGFFKINRSLLTSIAGAVFTYLVILFQFED